MSPTRSSVSDDPVHTRLDSVLGEVLPPDLSKDERLVDEHLREGRFQRSLALVSGLSSVLGGLEVGYEHYRGSYGQRIMYTPVICSAAGVVAGFWAFESRWAARTVLRWVSIVTIADGLIGFGFHIRGIHRKPGGWRIPIVNLIMGPPVFAPILFAIAAYLGLIASFLRREEAPETGGVLPRPAHPKAWTRYLPGPIEHERISWTQDLREGRFQKHLAAATVVGTFCSGIEAWYSHYKNNFNFKVQWTPILLTPALMAAGVGAMKSRRVAHTWLPAMSALAVANGTVGFFYHVRGVLRRPGGRKHWIYNVLYGPPVFAPLLFAACGSLGLLAALMRREK